MMFRIATIFFFLTLISNRYFSQDAIFEKQTFGKDFPMFCYDISFFQNQIFFATNQGVYVLKNNSPKQIHFSKVEVLAFKHQDSILCFNDLNGNFHYLKNLRVYAVNTPQPFRKFLQNTIVNDFSYYHDTLWVGTVLGENAYKVSSSGFMELFNDTSSFSYIFDKNTIFFSGNYGNIPTKKVIYFGNSTTQNLQFSSNSGITKIIALKTEKNAFLLAKGQEIIHFNTSTKKIKKTFLGKSITCLFMDSDHKIWIGTSRGGVICYPDGNIGSDNSINYLGNKTISGICEDNNKQIWIATVSEGIFKQKSIPKLHYNTTVVFNTDSTSQAIPTSLKHQNLVPSSNSIVINDSTLHQIQPPTCVITSIEINHHDTIFETVYQLQSSSNSIRILLGGLPISSAPFKYRYKLLGKDTNWIYSEKNEINYSLLPEGNYTFEAACMDKYGKWSLNTVKITFIVNPPFWKTGFFWLIIGLALLLGLILFIFIKKQSEYKKKQTEWQHNKQLIETEMMALRSQMNPHFMFNTLSSIQTFIVNHDNDKAEYYLTVFSKLLRKVLENSKQPYITIAQEIDTLQLYLRLEQLRLNNRFGFKISVADNIDKTYDTIPPMLIQPIVENAIWHGINHLTNKQGNITVAFHREKNYITCIVSDNGVGRSKANQLKTNSEHNSIATKNIEQRLKLLSELHKSTFVFEIIDLYENNIPTGTRVIIKIPLTDD